MRKLAEVVRAMRNEDLQRLNADLDEFVDILAHDVLNPVRTCQMFLQQLARSVDLEGKPKEYLEHSRRAIANLEAILLHLLRFSRGSAEQDVDQTNVAAIIDQVNESFQALREEVGFDIECTTDAPVMIDKMVMYHVLSNVVGNAIAHRHLDRRPKISVDARVQDDRVVIRVTDNARGMDAATVERIFDMHWHHADSQGSGLGLGLTRHMLRRIGGSIDVESEPDVGSTFIIDVPAKPTEASVT